MALTETAPSTSTAAEAVGASEHESLLRNHDFLVVLATQLFSGFRGPLLWFSQAWYVNSAAPEDRRVLLLGVLATVNGLAFLGWSLFGGALADRYPRRTTLIASHLAGAVLVGITAGVLAIPGTEHGGAWFFLILPLFATFGLMNAQDLAARTALVSDVVPTHHLTSAVTLNWLVMAVVMLLANFLGGTLVEALGFGPTYAIGVVPHLAIVGLLWKLRLRAGPADVHAHEQSLFGNVADGIAYLKQDSAVRWTVLLMWIAVFGGMNVLWTLGAAWMHDVLDLGAAGWSRLTIFWSVGMIGASVYLVTKGSYRGKGRIFIGAGVLYGVAVVVYAFSRSIPLTGIAMLFGGLAFQLQQTVGTTILQTVVPRQLLGRVTALLFLAPGLAQVSGLPIGLIGQAVGMQVLFPIVGGVMLASGVAIALIQRPLRTLD
ncbi:MAG: MFS transporter [Dehalococcoidia bacterium]|nr:MFS transporter [Dehalococcoidia bacterium]